jgi:uncharacterized protein involved in exopolysaccharide biosynthesis
MEPSSDSLHTEKEDQIDIIALIAQLWLSRIFILKSVLIGLILGLVVAILTPNQYSSSSMFTPNYGQQESGASGLKGLASLAGIDIGSMGGSSKEISPMLYGKIIESAVFKMAILSAPLQNVEQAATVREYLNQDSSTFLTTVKSYTIGLPAKVITLFKSEKDNAALLIDGIEKISEADYALFQKLNNLIQININDKDGYIELVATTQDPLVSAQLAKQSEALLQKEIIGLKTKGSLELLTYLETQFEQKRNLLNKAQDNLSRFKDQNMNIARYSFSNSQIRLETELQTANSVFTNVNAQLEQVKLQVAKETPVFSIIKPVVIPSEKSAPKHSMILFTYIFLALIASVGFVLVKEPVKEALKAVKNKQ